MANRNHAHAMSHLPLGHRLPLNLDVEGEFAVMSTALPPGQIQDLFVADLLGYCTRDHAHMTPELQAHVNETMGQLRSWPSPIVTIACFTDRLRRRKASKSA